MEALGRTRWAIAEGYIPSESSSSDRALVSHETACILNADRDAVFESDVPIVVQHTRLAPRRARAAVDHGVGGGVTVLQALGAMLRRRGNQEP